MKIHPFEDKERAIQKSEPIELYGLTFYPILMEEYQRFQECKPALLFRQGTLPAIYAAQHFLSAVWAVESDSITHGGNGTGLFAHLMMNLVLALRLEGMENIHILCEKSNSAKLSAITVAQGETIAKITPRDFTKVRSLIAEQNGETLPDESENPELLQALAERERITGSHLNVSFRDLLSSVAYLSNVMEREIYGWSILEFEQRRRAIDRHLTYMVCNIGEMSGNVKWKNGNPSPSWCFDRSKDNLNGFMLESDMISKFGKAGNIKQ